MSLYGSIDNIYLTRDIMTVILFWLPESEWYLLKLNKSLLTLIQRCYKDYPIDVLARRGHIESLEYKCKVENVMPKVSDICNCGNLKIVKRFLHNKPFHNLWGFSVAGNFFTRMVRALDLGQEFSLNNFDFSDLSNVNGAPFQKLYGDMSKTIDCGLHGACSSGCMDVVEYLFDKCQTEGMDERVLRHGLLGAFKSENTKIIDWLIDKGANLNKTLEVACSLGEKELCKKIVAYGADKCIVCNGHQH